MLETVKNILARCRDEDSPVPPTELYSEGWMLRLVLYWFEQSGIENHELAFCSGSRWCSEALLPTQFAARYRGDELAESWTHADGVIGHFTLGNKEKKRDLLLAEEAAQFKVLEAKMYSGLSAGVRNAPYFNQAARNVACMAETIHRSPVKLENIKDIGFYVLLPREHINKKPNFIEFTDREKIKSLVERRVNAYGGKEEKIKQKWFVKSFLPLLDRINISCLTWEDVLAFIRNHAQEFYRELKLFYNLSKRYN